MAKKQPANASKKASVKKGPAPKTKTKNFSSQNTASKKTMSPSTGGVTIRMYRQGLGDCFLLAFDQAKSTIPKYVMIDCGVLLGTENQVDRMGKVIDNIVETTNGQIDFLIVTHEHWDHISGFQQYQEKLDELLESKKLEFKNVLLAWTEDPLDKVAKKIRDGQKRKLANLKTALTKLGIIDTTEPLIKFGVNTNDLQDAIGLFDFLGPDFEQRYGDHHLQAASTSQPKSKVKPAMDWIHDKASRYCQPGEVIPIDNTGVRAFILGPPKDLTLLKQDAPKKGKNEAYGFAAKLDVVESGLNVMLNDDNTKQSDPNIPFEKEYRITYEEAQSDPFFVENYGFANDELSDDMLAYRRIEFDWMLNAVQFALKMDGDTNNTSLAIAFELRNGKTLIFPGDAQIGNWKSWSTVDFSKALDPKENPQNYSAEEILNRAVFYKVGHHGSHNATLKEHGLEDMTSGDLIAMIPVSKKMAKKKKWKMPFNPLYKRLKQLTDERVILADQTPDEFIKDSNKNQPLWKTFKDTVRFSDIPFENSKKDPLYVECDIK